MQTAEKCYQETSGENSIGRKNTGQLRINYERDLFAPTSINYPTNPEIPSTPSDNTPRAKISLDLLV